MQSLNFDSYLQQPERARANKPATRLLFTFISELSKEEKLSYKTRLLLFKITPTLAELTDEESALFSNPEHPARRIISSIISIFKTTQEHRDPEEYIYRSLKESVKTLRARKLGDLDCLERVASDLEYIVKIAKIRSKPSLVSSVSETSAGCIAQSKIKAAFIIFTEATKFDLEDHILVFGLRRWLEFLTVSFIKYPDSAVVEKEAQRMTFSLFYSCSQSMEFNSGNSSLLSTLSTKVAKLADRLGHQCLGHEIDFSELHEEIASLMR